MKFILGAFVLFAAAAIQVQGELPYPGIDCPRMYKCDRQYTPFLAHNGCRCQVFFNPCHLTYNNANYAPEYSQVSKANLQYCNCYATPKWLKSPASAKCSYNQVLCFVPVTCIDESYTPLTASNGCECKVFRNRCDMEKFNCAFMNSNGGFEEIDPVNCNCKYSPPVIRIDEPIAIE